MFSCGNFSSPRQDFNPVRGDGIEKETTIVYGVWKAFQTMSDRLWNGVLYVLVISFPEIISLHSMIPELSTLMCQ